jgi:ribosomal protein S18 acetylase RimI-like enzyme
MAVMWRCAVESDDPVLIEQGEKLNIEDPCDGPFLKSNVTRSLEFLRQNPSNGRLVVLEIDECVRGYSILMSFWSNELGGEVCIVDELFVEREFRNRGYATKLFSEIFRNRNLWKNAPIAIELEVHPSNTKALNFYASLGFEPQKNSFMRFCPK